MITVPPAATFEAWAQLTTGLQMAVTLIVDKIGGAP